VNIIHSAFDELQKCLKVKTNEFYEIVHILENSKYKNKLNFIQKDLIKRGVK
jgi:hypothetical protein